MCALLSRHGMVSADAAHVQRLERALQQRDSELKLLNTKLDKMKREPVCVYSLVMGARTEKWYLTHCIASHPSHTA